jgi:hypothetical protein
MRLRVLLLAAVAVLAVPSTAAAHPVNVAQKKHNHGRKAAIAGTWNVQVTPSGAPSFAALLLLTRDGSVIETESDAPGTGLGSWERVGRSRFRFAFQVFTFSPTGAPAGHVVVRSVVTLANKRLSGPFRFQVFDPAGNVVQSGSGTATATRFQIPPF